MSRPEYPRPQFVRDQWLNLNGTWRFDFDDQNTGLASNWHQTPPLTQEITVPFAFQAPASGIGNNDFHDVVWYAREFDVPQDWQRVLLHFGAVDYRAWVWVNGIFVTYHQGGHTPFSADVTDMLNGGANELVVRVEDKSTDKQQPRGKQYWERDSAAIFYTRTTGIWQTVWLEPVSECYIDNLRITPDIDGNSVKLEYELGGTVPDTFEIEAQVAFQGAPIAAQSETSDKRSITQTLAVGDNVRLWSPEQPNLYDLQITLLYGEQVLDEVSSYFGMRKISIDGGVILLNNQPYIMRLVLDQGYHPEGVLTFPTDEDFKRDIELTKTMGFNGVRKHQKVEDPRYLYWADQMGLLVWGEMANAYEFSPEYIARITAEWQEAVRRDYSHPCVVVWTPMNESWGVPDLSGDAKQRAHLVALYQLTKSLDTTRPVISNDGWEHAQTDILTIHDYESQGEVLQERYRTVNSTLSARPAKRDLLVTGHSYQDEPLLLSEYGGVAYRKSQQEGWGYSTASDESDFLARYAAIMDAVNASPVLQGYCYTQLTDVEQEINGLLTYDRQPKADLAAIARINLGQK